MRTPTVDNMYSSNGNKVANQFIIKMNNHTFFQSYDSVIAMRNNETGKVVLDVDYWDYSVTTGRYRNQFLGLNKAQTLNKIATGEIKLKKLN